MKKNIDNEQKKKRRKIEELHQIALVDWSKQYWVPKNNFKLGEIMYAIPNGGSRNAVEGYRLKLQGVLAGIPDLHIPIARKGYHGMYIENKSPDGTISDNQEEKIRLLKHLGYYVIVSHDWSYAKEMIEEYLQ